MIAASRGRYYCEIARTEKFDKERSKNPYSFQKLQYVYFHKIRSIFQFYEVHFFTKMGHFCAPDLGSTPSVITGKWEI